jgi:hypothetical protein
MKVPGLAPAPDLPPAEAGRACCRGDRAYCSANAAEKASD